MNTILKKVDVLYFRLVDAWRALTGKETFNGRYVEGVSDGVDMANSRINAALDGYDPYQFENQHFKMGYYYAKEQVKKAMI